MSASITLGQAGLLVGGNPWIDGMVAASIGPLETEFAIGKAALGKRISNIRRNWSYSLALRREKRNAR